MAGLNVGVTPVSKVYVDTTPATKVYVGSTLAWQSLPGNLLGQWGFLDNLNDTSGNGRHGTFESGGGTLTYGTGPTAGTRAVVFNNQNDSINYGRTGLEAPADGFVIMGWLKLTPIPTGANNYIVSVLSKARAAGSSRSRIGVTGNGVNKRGAYAARWKNDLSFNDDIVGADDNNWHHHCLVDGNTGFAYYIDGTLKASGSRSFDNSTSPTWENFPWRTGRNSDMGDQWAGGSVSGVRIIQGQLTQAQVIAWMNTAIT